MIILRTTALLAYLSFFIIFSHTVFAAQGTTPYDNKGAVIYAYHRIGEDGFPDTNLRTDLFEAHVREIIAGEYNVLSIPQIIEALQNEDILPPKTIGITFEGGHKSILNEAVPLLLKNNLPFTVFISSNKADWNLSEYLNWNDIKKLRKHKYVTVGLHPASYTRLTGSTETEILLQINKAKSRYRENLGTNATLFAYPFGEYSQTYHDLVASNGFNAAFGQQSGVVWPNTDLFALPRFTMTDNVADLERFRLTANALPLPVTDIEPQDPYLQNRSPVIGFTVHESLKGDLDQLSCFSSVQDTPQLETIGRRVELRHKNSIDQSRIRINCTLPGPSGSPDSTPNWRWFGMLLNVPGSVLEEMISEDKEEQSTTAPVDQASLP